MGCGFVFGLAVLLHTASSVPQVTPNGRSIVVGAGKTKAASPVKEAGGLRAILDASRLALRSSLIKFSSTLGQAVPSLLPRTSAHECATLIVAGLGAHAAFEFMRGFLGELVGRGLSLLFFLEAGASRHLDDPAFLAAWASLLLTTAAIFNALWHHALPLMKQLIGCVADIPPPAGPVVECNQSGSETAPSTLIDGTLEASAENQPVSTASGAHPSSGEWAGRPTEAHAQTVTGKMASVYALWPDDRVRPVV